METLEQVVKYVQSLHQNDDIGLASFWCLYCLLWTYLTTLFIVSKIVFD